MSQKVRLRRLRYNKTVRDLFEDTHLRPQDLIYPIFVCEGKNIKNEIKSMPGQYQVSVDRLPSLCNRLIELNIKSVILFGVPDKKDDDGKVAQDDNGIVQRAWTLLIFQRSSFFLQVENSRPQARSMVLEPSIFHLP